MIEEPIDLDTICKKEQNNEYASLEDLMNDFNLMFDNTCLYNEPESQMYRDALTLKKFCIQVGLFHWIEKKN